MRENRLRALLDDDTPTLGTRIHSVWPGIVEVIGHTRMFDYVEFLGEYAPFDLHDLDGLCRAADLYDLGAIIKVDQEPRTFLAQRAIGAGFQGVLFADCRSVDDARACVAAARPETPEHGGTYGVGARRMAYMGYGGTPEYVARVADTVVALMIEKRGAVEALDEILALPGVDLIQFGAVDYSLSIGRVGESKGAEIMAVRDRRDRAVPCSRRRRAGRDRHARRGRAVPRARCEALLDRRRDRGAVRVVAGQRPARARDREAT